MMLKCILLSVSGFFFMGNKLIKIGNDVSCPKFGEKINYCPWFSDQTSKVIFFLVQMEKFPLPDAQTGQVSCSLELYTKQILLLSSVGALLPPEKEKTEHFDSNCITPVSVLVEEN